LFTASNYGGWMTSPATVAEPPALDALGQSMQAFSKLVTQGRILEVVLKRARIDLTRADVSLLFALLGAGEGIRLGDLADRLVVDAPTVTRRVQQLEARNLVRRSPDPADRRAQLVELSPAGGRMIERAAAAFRRWLEGVLADWSGPQRDQLAELLQRFTGDIYADLECHGH
jgi:DNA-binding MarR family transcriptional regulator